jgi:hypothetical protein
VPTSRLSNGRSNWGVLLGHNRRYEPFDLYRRTDWNDNRSAAQPDGSITTAIEKAGRPVGQADISGDEALLKNVAAATSGQPGPGGDRTGSADPAARRGPQTDNGKSGQRFTGR